MQSSCMAALMELSEADERVVYLTADSGEGGLDLMYRRNFPERALNFGIAEENMIAVAAGMATCDKIPFLYTAAPFLVYRGMEFIRNDACMQNLPVKFIGSGSGLSVGALGATHHTTEDVAILRSLPNLTIMSPATPLQAYACVKAAYEMDGPVYIRLGMSKETEYLEDGYTLNGKPELWKKPEDVDNRADTSGKVAKKNVILLSTGTIMCEVMDAAELLTQHGYAVSVINVPVLKPLKSEDLWQVIEASRVDAPAKEKTILAVVEEHNENGGLGSIVTECLYEKDVDRRLSLVKINVGDRFAVGYGKTPQVRKENGLDAESIMKRIVELA